MNREIVLKSDLLTQTTMPQAAKLSRGASSDPSQREREYTVQKNRPRLADTVTNSTDLAALIQSHF